MHDYFAYAKQLARAQCPASERRSRITYADLAEVLRDGEDPDATALLDAVHNYDNAEIGRIFSRMVQAYCRRVDDDLMMLKPQCD